MGDSLRDRLQAALGDYYSIERELPAGGMSRLFVATERSLAREVVVKVLPPELASEVSAARFQREMSVAAHLQHPHVLPVLSAGSRNGLLYYIMPYVRGESLRDRLRREGRLPVDDAIRVLSEIADALAYAHERGVVHRDVKPENILIAADHAVLADFGIARALGGDDRRPTGEHLTGTGVSIGTPGYMAPEQVAGEAGVDARTDVYALAIVGYEMLVGAPPFAGQSARAIVAAHLVERPPSVRTQRPDTPAAVSDAIDRALSKEPVDRPATGAEFRQALGAGGGGSGSGRASPARRMRLAAAAAAAAVVLVLAVAWLGWRSAHRPAAHLSMSTIAVMPFASSGPPTTGYLGPGMVDLLSATLDGAGDLHSTDPRAVLAAASHIVPTTLDVDGARAIASRLGAELFVLGTVVDIGGRLRLSAALYDGGSNRTIAHVAVDGDTSDVFGLVDRLTAQLLAGRQSGPSARITQLASVTTRSLPALKAYLDGETALRANAFQQAVDALHRAIAADSAFALAYFRLSIAEEWLTRADEATTAAERAVHFGDHLSLHDRQLLAAMLAERRGDVPGAERQLRSLLSTYPDDYEAWWQLGEILFHYWPLAGRPLADAEAPFRRVLELDPMSEPALVHLVRIMANTGRRAATDSFASRSLALAPVGGRSYEMRVVRAVVDGDTAGFASILAELPRADDFDAWLPVWSLTVFVQRFDAARAVLERILDPARPPNVQARSVTMLAALDVLHGRMVDAQATLDRLTPLSEAWMLEYRGLLAVLPYLPTDTTGARAMRGALERWNAAAVPEVPVPSAWFSANNGLHPLYRAYLIGLLDTHLGDTVGAARAARGIPALGAAQTHPVLARVLASAVTDEASWATGRVPAATEPLVVEYYQWLIGSPFRAESRERYRRAQAMAAAGQDTVALRWYSSFETSASDDILYLAPSHLERARIYARLGQKAAAERHYRAFVALWHECDPALRPIVAHAFRELEKL